LMYSDIGDSPCVAVRWTIGPSRPRLRLVFYDRLTITKQSFPRTAAYEEWKGLAIDDTSI
jgi:hypothetical protein